MSSELYQVEEVLGRKSESGRIYYRIRWSGYSSQYNTWEPEENLTNCKDLIEEFMEKEGNKERKRTLRSSPARSKRALAATAALSSDDEGGAATKTPQKKQQRSRKSPGRPAKATKQQQQPSSSSDVSSLPAGLFGRDYKLRPRENKLLAVSSEEESSPAVTRKAAKTTTTQTNKADGRMSLIESNFRKRIADVNKGASTSKKTTSTPQAKSSTAAKQDSPQIKTKLKFDSSKRRSGRNKQPLISIEQVTEGEENKNTDPNLSVIAEADDDPVQEAKEPSPADTSSDGGFPGWPPVGWKEFAIAAFVTGVAAVGYVCYTTDYCKYC